MQNFSEGGVKRDFLSGVEGNRKPKHIIEADDEWYKMCKTKKFTGKGDLGLQNSDCVVAWSAVSGRVLFVMKQELQ